MNEKDLEFEDLSFEEIMKEFGSSEELLDPAEEMHSAQLEDTGDLLEVIGEIGRMEAPSEETEKAEEAPAQPAEEHEPAEEPEPKELGDTRDLTKDLEQLRVPEPEELGDTRDLTEELEQLREPEQKETVQEEVEEAEEPAEPEGAPASLEDTVRLDNLAEVSGEKVAYGKAMDDATARIGSIWDEEADEDEDSVEIKFPAPIVFRPKQRLRDLKRDLIAGPEKRYYELAELGVGKLQVAMLVCMVVVLLSAGAGVLYSAGLVPENRMRLMVFSQILAMLIGALMGSQQMIDGVCDLFRGRFSLNTMLAITFAAGCADAYFCLQELRVPICAAFTLEVAMALWAAYHRRTTEMGQMDTMRKAVRLDSVVKVEDYLDGKSAYLRGEGQVADFMEKFDEIPRPERIQNTFGAIALLVSIAVAVLAGVMHGISMAVQIFSTTLLVAVPASFFVSITRPMAALERRLHRLGTVLCGWSGIKGLGGKALFPLSDSDLFPAGSGKMNGVKFYGSRTPETVIAYAAAMMRANGGGLEPAFDQLLTSRNGARFEAKNLQFYGNGGIGGEICDEPVLMGSLDFLKDMGLEIPEGVLMKQAVYVAIDGELSGLFAITYSRMKYTASGLATLCGNRKLNLAILARDFMVTGPFLKEKFGVRTRRMLFPDREVREELAGKQIPEGTPSLALTTQEGLAPAAYAITGARALRTSWKLGLVIHIIGGVLGMLIMAALAYLGSTELLTPLNILLYQLLWLVPGVLATLWPGTI